VAVGAVVFNKNRVLLVRRGQAPSERLWAIPGGRVELGESLREAAQREVEEETGVTVQAGDPIYAFDLIERDQAGRVRFHYVIIDLTADYVKGELRAGDDACDVRWVSSEEIRSLPISEKTRQLLRERFGFGT
jgi:ADP-ribose pyrophosphatase